MFRHVDFEATIGLFGNGEVGLEVGDLLMARAQVSRVIVVAFVVIIVEKIELSVFVVVKLF